MKSYLLVLAKTAIRFISAVWVVITCGLAGVLWIALTIYPTKWFDLPWWATLGLSMFWLWQIELARPSVVKLIAGSLHNNADKETP